MQYELTVKDRVMLLDLVPKEGRFLFVKMVQTLLGELSFSQEENDKLIFQQTIKGEVRWVEKAAEGMVKVVEIPQTIIDEITASLRRLEEKGKLTIDHVQLYEKFVKD